MEELLLTAAAAKSLQSCPTLCDPIDGSPPGSAVPGILQARTLEWVAISFSNAWKWKWKWTHWVVSNSGTIKSEKQNLFILRCHHDFQAHLLLWESLLSTSLYVLCSIRLFVTLWTMASQAPLSMGFSRQKYWSGLPCPPSGDLQDPGIEPMSSALLNLELDGFQNNIRSKHSYWDFLVTQW